MALYYLGNLVAHGVPPDSLIDANIRSDWSKLKTILDAQHVAEQRDGILPLTQELADSEEVAFNLVDSFPIEKVTDAANFKSLYYYYGIVTMSRVWRGTVYFRVANESIRLQVADSMNVQEGS